MFETGLRVGAEAEREAIYTAEIQNKSPARQKATELPRINLQLKVEHNKHLQVNCGILK